MVKRIKRRVKLDSKSYHTSLEHFKKGGNLYRPIVGILEKAYSKLIRRQESRMLDNVQWKCNLWLQVCD